jgi:hypothetical protein
MAFMTHVWVVQGCQVFGFLQRVFVPARDIRKSTLAYSNVRWKRKLIFLSLIASTINDIYQHIIDNKGCNRSAKIPIE